MKVLVLGSTGFVGRNIVEMLSPEFSVIKTSRQKTDSSFVYFDLLDIDSWQNILDINPDLIINASAYGVIKHEVDLESMYKINYLLIADFYTFLQKNNCNPFWIQLGTAFEYDLSIVGGISERSTCLPRTHYGISKLMFSQFLNEKAQDGRFSIFRPFGMFGKYEDESKFFPMLIKAQQDQNPIKLSAGTQQRDYFFVSDLGVFINSLVQKNELKKLPKVLNLGAGQAQNFKTYAEVLSRSISNYNASLWQWGEVSFRANESEKFYNASTDAKALGFETSPLQEAFLKTVQYYISINGPEK